MFILADSWGLFSSAQRSRFAFYPVIPVFLGPALTPTIIKLGSAQKMTCTAFAVQFMFLSHGGKPLFRIYHLGLQNSLRPTEMQKYWRKTNFVGAAAALVRREWQCFTSSDEGHWPPPSHHAQHNGEEGHAVVINRDPAQAEPTILELLKKAPSFPQWPAL